MYRILLAAVLTACLTGSAFAQTTGSIVGTLEPPHDHDFVLATALIPELSKKTTLAPDGSFRFDDVRPGFYVVEVRVPSLGTVAEVIEVRPGEVTERIFTLRPGSHSEEIVVTASADARDPFDLATPTTTLSGPELELRLQSSLGETLSGEAGVSSTFFGPGASRPIIRGLTGDRVRMLEGGLGTGDASGVSADHAVSTDPAQAERIEIVRGPATLLYGSSAVGGVVNVIDERIPKTRAAGGVTGTVDLRGGTVADERNGSVALDGGVGDWAWHIDAGARETDDYDTPVGIIENTDLETLSVRAGATRFFGDRGSLGVAVTGFDTDYGLPEAAHGHVGEEEDEHGEEEEGEETVRIDLEQRRFDLDGEVMRPFTGFQAARLRLGLTDYEHAELEGSEVGTRFFNDSLEARFELIQERRDRWTGSVGAQVFERELEAVGEEAFLPPTDTGRWALFTLQELDFGPVTWQVGARYESQDTDVTGALPSRSHDGLSGSAGLVWEASERFTVAASASRSVKLPAPEELYADGLHVATQAFEIGDAGLGEETGLGLDLSLRAEGERVSGEITLYRQDFDDFIYQAFTGREVEGFPVVAYRQQDAEFTGAEVKARVELYEGGGRHLHLRFVGDVVEAELAGGENLPRIPPLRLGGGFHYHSERWNASADAQWIDDQTDVAALETPTDGYTLLHAAVGYRFLFQDKIVDLLLRGRNLTDELARQHTSFLKDVAPLPGRDVSLSVKLLF